MRKVSDLDCLGFDELRLTNVRRCVDAFHPIAAWSPTDWACAMAGEAGETCNVVKKLRRLDSSPQIAHKDREALLHDAADEIADTVIYLDLLAARLGIDFGAAVRRKFNATSVKVGSEVRL